MREPWTERVPQLRGGLTTLREIADSDVSTLFTLFSDPAVTAYMAPAPPTLAKFAGFVAWSHRQREQGEGVCFGIVPDGMTAAVGIIQIRSMSETVSTAEWGFVLSRHFWSTGVFVDAARAVGQCGFTTMRIQCLEARIALRNRRAHAAVRKLGAHAESTLAAASQTGIPRDPEVVWTLREDDWRRQPPDPRVSVQAMRERMQKAVESARSELRESEVPATAEPYPLFLFDRRRRE